MPNTGRSLSSARVCGAIAAALLALAPAVAQPRLAAIFSDHAVLQRDTPLPVWGWASPGEKVSVTLGQATADGITDEAGRWQVVLPPQALSTRPLTLKVVGSAAVEIRDVLLGDVWLCGGQSNMEWSLGGCDAPKDIAAADLPLVRHFGVELNFAVAPAEDVRGAWRVCTPEAAPGFTAVGYHFARRVHAETGVPIGILRSCVGGTNIELWMSQETLLGTPTLEPYARVMRESLDGYRRDLAAALPGIERWSMAARDAQRARLPLPLPPAWPEFPFMERVARPRCVTLHNGMIAPLVPMALRGAIWYQGESNAGNVADGLQYVEKKQAMLADWRRWFGRADLPFYFVQLASWQAPTDNPAGGDGWAWTREAQQRCLEIPHTGMAVAIDIGDAADIHPRNKADVGDRLARWALARDYGKAIEPSGPLFRGLTIEGSKARVAFDHVGRGLMVGSKRGRDPVQEEPSAALKRFAVAGADRQWRWAEAKIDGDTVVVWSAEVPAPVAVRYAFSMNPAGANLYNRDGLPAAPFRTDDW